MALTFTGTLSAATAGRDEIRTLLIGMIGCNIAWGLVDAVMFLMTSLTERGHDRLTISAIKAAASPAAAHEIISGAVPPFLASILSRDDLEKVRLGLLGVRDLPPTRTRDDWLGALGVFLLVFLSTFPLVIPFLVIRDTHLALRTSNLIAIVLLFFTG